MKKINLILAVFLTAIASTTFVSCNKENTVLEKKKADVSQNEVSQNLVLDFDVAVEEGILTFKTGEDYEKALNTVNNVSDKDFNNWEKSIGFISIRTIQDNAIIEIEKAKNEEELFLILTKFNNLFEIITDETGEKELLPILDNVFYKKLINSDGIIKIGEKVGKITKNYEIFTDYSNLEELKSITENNISKYYKNINYEIYNINNQNKNYIYGWEEYARNEANDRRAKLSLYVERVDGLNTYLYRSYVRNQAQKKVLGLWISYSPSSLTVQNCYYTANYYDYSIDYNVKQWTQTTFNKTVYNDNEILELKNLSDFKYNSYPPYPYFSQGFYAKGYSSDANYVYAIID